MFVRKNFKDFVVISSPNVPTGSRQFDRSIYFNYSRCSASATSTVPPRWASASTSARTRGGRAGAGS